MTDLRKAAEMALEALDCLPWQASPQAIEATQALRQALSQPEQKIMDCVYPRCETAGGCNGPCSISFSTGQPNREWVEITKGECDELFRSASDHVEYAYSIEAKLKEKNT